jgi:hypothetical protein
MARDFGSCGGFLVAGKRAPLGAVPGLAHRLRDQDSVNLRARIDHAFEYRSSCLLPEIGPDPDRRLT